MNGDGGEKDKSCQQGQAEVEAAGSQARTSHAQNLFTKEKSHLGNGTSDHRNKKNENSLKYKVLLKGTPPQENKTIKDGDIAPWKDLQKN